MWRRWPAKCILSGGVRAGDTIVLDVEDGTVLTKIKEVPDDSERSMILLSYVNTQLRDYYESLEALCSCRGIRKDDLLEKMDQIDYHYDADLNQFV